MNRLTTALLIATFAGTASAGDIYQGWARGNGDLYPHNLSEGDTGYSQKTGIQPGVGDTGMSALSQRRGWTLRDESQRFRIYHGWARGNSDLYPEGFEGAGAKAYMKAAMQPGVGDSALGGRYGVLPASLSEDKPFIPSVETFGE